MTALLALWNEIDPAFHEAYEAWHMHEHVPERLTCPGFRHASRYVRGEGTHKRWFTLYQLDSVDALESTQYRQLLASPSVESARMRPAFRNVRRIVCVPETAAWAGLGRNLAVATWPIATSPTWLPAPSQGLSIQMAQSVPSAPHPAFGAQPDSGLALRLCFVSGARPSLARDAARRIAMSETGEEPLSLEVFRLIAHLAR
ncbi:MAG: hypothetical protein ACRDBH_10810 [Bosea sp. (in: a-proteobacteria)]